MGTFSVSGVRLWTSADKSKEIFSGQEFLLADLPTEVFVEGVMRGTGGVSLRLEGPSTTLYTGMVRPVSLEWRAADTSASDTVTVTAGLGLTAYRPTQGPNSYEPFKKTPVKEANEFDPKLGPGIRRNTDFDSGQSIQDRLIIQTTAIENENDLIEVRIDAVPGVTNLILDVQFPLRLYYSYTGGDPVPVTSVGQNHSRTGPLSLANDLATVFVEWPSGAGTADLNLINASNNKSVDTLKFHRFEGIVTALGGRDQDPSDPPPMGYGVFDVAVQLYESGYDVYMYNEKTVKSDGTGLPYDEIVAAIKYRSVTQAAIFGYSRGGSATYRLSKGLDDNRKSIGTFNLMFTSYIDAIQRDTWDDRDPETNRPPSSRYHLNFYQTSDALIRGAATNPINPGLNVKVEDQPWEGSVNHKSIDDIPQLKKQIVDRINEKVRR